jgi:hypothetical protein
MVSETRFIIRYERHDLASPLNENIYGLPICSKAKLPTRQTLIGYFCEIGVEKENILKTEKKVSSTNFKS